MCSESVRLNHTTPVRIKRHRSLWTNAFAPVVFVSKATAWPADVWDLQCLQRGNHVVAHAPCVRDVGIGANPDPLVNSMAQMFRELAEDVAVDLWAWLGD